MEISTLEGYDGIKYLIFILIILILDLNIFDTINNNDEDSPTYTKKKPTREE